MEVRGFCVSCICKFVNFKEWDFQDGDLPPSETDRGGIPDGNIWKSHVVKMVNVGTLVPAWIQSPHSGMVYSGLTTMPHCDLMKFKRF